MTRRKKITIIAVLLLLILLLILFWMLRARQEQVSPATIVVTERNGDQAPSAAIPPGNQEERILTASIQTLSKTFTERYGSFSSESDFENLRDVIPLMSASFAAETEAYVASAEQPEAFYAVSTRVVSISIDAMNEDVGTATVTISTQREEARDTPQNISVRYQNVRLTFVRESGMWKVDSATWL